MTGDLVGKWEYAVSPMNMAVEESETDGHIEVAYVQAKCVPIHTFYPVSQSGLLDGPGQNEGAQQENQSRRRGQCQR